MNSLGFTLIELLVVVGVIAIMASGVIVTMRGVREGAITARTRNFANSVRTQLILGEVGNWSFDGNTQDTSGLHNHGTLWSGTTNCTINPGAAGCPTYVDGVVRRALSFDGVDDFVTIRDVDWFDGRRPWTISFWMNSGAFRGDWGRIMSDETAVGSEPLQIVREASLNRIWITLRQAGGAEIMLTHIPFTPNTWHHIAFTYNGTELIGYRDGAFIDRMFSTATPGSSTNNLTFGRASGGGVPWNGLLDEVQIYNEALRAGEVQMRYVQGLNGLLARGMISQEEFDQRMNELQLTDN